MKRTVLYQDSPHPSPTPSFVSNLSSHTLSSIKEAGMQSESVSIVKGSSV